MKLLVGRRFEDPEVQKELARQPYSAVQMAHGGVGIKVLYNDEEIVMAAEHLMAILLVKAQLISSNAAGGVALADSVVAVPHWFTDSQRRGILQACEIAQLNCLKVANESTCIGLGYGIFKSAKKLFSETEPTRIMFIDIGYTGYCVSIVSYIQEHMTVLSTVCDREVSGRDFDDVIIEFLAESFQKKTGIDVRKNRKAVLKLQAAAEKAKKTLSPTGVMEASVSVECLAEDRDLNVILSRDEFEARAKGLVARLRLPIERALREANITREQLSEVEIVGGSTRISVVKKTLGEILGLDHSAMNFGLKTTMNSDEAVARGAALQAAMLSSRMKVKPFHIIDRLAYGIQAHFESSGGTAGDDGEMEVKGSSVALYSRGDELPHKPRRITFRNKTTDFSITLTYDGDAAALLPPGESTFIGKFTVHIPEGSPAGDVRVTFNIDKHGLVYLQSAQLMVECTPEEIAAEIKAEEKAGENKESKEESKEEKKRYRKIDLNSTAAHHALTAAQVKESLEREAAMAFEDKLIIETADKRNELESYIYSMRDKLDGTLKEFATSGDKDKLKALMTAAEDWLYGDGFEATKGEYSRKIEELRAVGDPVEERLAQHNNRPNAVEALRKQMDLCKAFAANYEEAYAHIEEEDRDKLRKEVQSVEAWLFDMLGKQGDLPLSAPPVLTCENINAKRNALFNVYSPIKNKPKPPPPAPPAPTAPPAPEKAEQKPAEAKEKEGKPDDVPMEQAKGGPESEAEAK